MNAGKLLFAQLMDFLPWTSFARSVARYDGDHRVRSLSCAEQFRAMTSTTPRSGFWRSSGSVPRRWRFGWGKKPPSGIGSWQHSKHPRTTCRPGIVRTALCETPQTAFHSLHDDPCAAGPGQCPFACGSLRVPFDTQPSSPAYPGEVAPPRAAAVTLNWREYQLGIHRTALPSDFG